jgi:outer membrane protein OmpA-like peptidoglycan-associated protein
MKKEIIRILGVVMATMLAGCAGQPQQFVVQQPDEQKPQTVTFPNGTTFGGASGTQASTLAQLVVDSNNNNMKEYEQLQEGQAKNLAASSKNLQTSQQALGMLEQMSQQQGTGEITLFFSTGSATLPSSGLQYDRLVNFLDYLSRDSRGRKVIFVMIGSASATGSLAINEKLSRERSQAPEPIIDQYLVNVQHQFYKVYGLGDLYAPKNVTLQEDQRYQSVRIIAVYETSQIPKVPAS